jgi:hypothetical protein
LIDLSQVIEILASLGVIAGIIFLGIELRQNNALLAAQARYNLVVRRADMNAMLTAPHVLDALHKYASGAEMTPTEHSIVYAISLRFIEMWDWQYAEFRAGMLKESELPVAAWRLWFHEETELPVVIKGTWNKRKAVMRPDFVQFVEEKVVNR